MNALRERESVAVGDFVINDVIISNALRAAALRGVRVLVIFQLCLMKLDRDTILKIKLLPKHPLHIRLMY